MITVKVGTEEIPINDIQSVKRNMAISDVPELSLMVVNRKNNAAYPYLNEESVIITPDGHEWRVRPASQATHYKNIKAMHIVFDLAELPFNETLTGTYTASTLLPLLLNGTGFTLDLDSTDLEPIELDQWGRLSKWKAFKTAVDALGAEFTVLPGRVIKVRKELSVDHGQQIRYGYNLKNIIKKTDSSGVVTHIIVNYGEELANSVTFTSSNASNYNRAFYGEIINDERITEIETARKRAEEKFSDIDLSYEVSIAQTGEMYELGEVVYTIYEPLDDLSITTRVIKTVEEWNGDDFVLTEVTVGNYVFQTADEILQGQINDTNNKIDDSVKKISLRFEETETIIKDQYTAITNEYTSAIDISARELTSEFNQKVDTVNAHIAAQYTQITAEYNSKITQTAQEIRNEVSASVTSINSEMSIIQNDLTSVTQTASALQSTVSSHQTTLNGYGTRISSAESTITQQANEISQKVSQTDYNGNTIATLINQTATTVTIQASKINLVGAVTVLSNISGNLGTITAGTINSVNVNSAYINISEDIKVGNKIELGSASSYATKTIQFNSYNRITGDGYSLKLAGIRIDLSAANINMEGAVDFSNATVSNLTADKVGPFHFAYEATGKLAVYRYGSKLGDLTLS